MKILNGQILDVKAEIGNKNSWLQFLKMHSPRSSELTGCKVSHGNLQHHHHHWPHHHRRQHNQHDVHQLFQSDLIFRIPETSLSPRHALSSFSGWDGLPPKTSGYILTLFCFPSICIYLLLNDQSSFQASSCIVRLVSIFCFCKSGKVVSNLKRCAPCCSCWW